MNHSIPHTSTSPDKAASATVRTFANTIALLAVAVASVAGFSHLRAAEKPTPTVVQPIASNSVESRVILLKFEDGASPDQIASVRQRFCALGRSQPGLEQVAWIEHPDLGPDCEFTHAVLLSFSCPVSAATYRENAECQAYATESIGVVAKSFEMKFQIDATNVSRPTGA